MAQNLGLVVSRGGTCVDLRIYKDQKKVAGFFGEQISTMSGNLQDCLSLFLC